MELVEEQIRQHMLFFKMKGSACVLVRFVPLINEYEKTECLKNATTNPIEQTGDTFHHAMQPELPEKLLEMTQKQRRKKCWHVSRRVSVLHMFRFPDSGL